MLARVWGWVWGLFEALALLPTVFWGDWYSRSAVVNMVFSTPLHWDVSAQRPVDTQEAAPAAVCTSAGASGCNKQERIGTIISNTLKYQSVTYYAYTVVSEVKA